MFNLHTIHMYIYLEVKDIRNQIHEYLDTFTTHDLFYILFIYYLNIIKMLTYQSIIYLMQYVF